MRWVAYIALILVFTGFSAFAQTPPPKPQTSLPKPTAEPANDRNYAPPQAPERDAPSDADVGPVQKHFVRASQPDDLAETQIQDNATLALKEKVVLDKKIKVPLVHDVQNDGHRPPGDNHALEYEIKYLNWGAVTQAQLKARQGHYFTITWENDGPKSDFTACFEYRQVKSKEIVRQLTQKAPQVSGATRSYFAVVDQAYLAYGPVSSWRFTLRKGNTIVAESKSFLW